MTKQKDEYERSELLNGELVLRPRQRSAEHNRIMANLANIMARRLSGTPETVFSDDANLFLDDKNRVTPDVMVACAGVGVTVKKRSVHGTPEFVAEVLSPASTKCDMDYKLKLYERCGVKEYWILNPKARSVIVYHLVSSRYVLDNVYHSYTAEEWAEMSADERADVDMRIRLSGYDGLEIALSDIFADNQQ